MIDQGPGIPAHYLRHVFERYWQQPGTPRNTGVGLGLYIARTYLEARGGNVRVESQVGHGSEFCCALPIIET